MSVLLALVATAQVAVVSPSPLRQGIPAWPRIAKSTTAAARRINVALTRLDASTRRSARECLDEGGGNPTRWDRRIDVTMRGPAFLSYLVTDDVDCGGAHPSNGHQAIVYDLASGRPVDWASLLPARLVGTQALNTGDDGVRMVTLSSARLTALYRQGYRSGQDDAEVDAQCRGVIEADAGPTALMAWLDARRGALALQYDMSHAVQLCSRPVYLSAEVLRREGASARLVTALLAARGRRR